VCVVASPLPWHNKTTPIRNERTNKRDDGTNCQLPDARQSSYFHNNIIIIYVYPSTVAAAALPNKRMMMMTKSSSSFAISWNPYQHHQQQQGKSAREGHGRPKPFMSTSTSSTTTEQEVRFWNQQPMDNNTHHSFIHSFIPVDAIRFDSIRFGWRPFDDSCCSNIL
jgi:hypothetical protein